MAWFDIFRLWKLSTTDDYISRRDKMRNIEGAGVTSPDVMPDIRGDGSFWSGGRGSVIRLRDSTDFIDLSSVTNRQSRYKEYERLRGVAEIETAMTVFADESCVSGETKVATPLGFIKIKTLAENKKPGELFLVYTYDQEKEDITLSWAHSPRKTKTAKTLKFALNDGSCLVCTPDHKILMRDGTWKEAKDIKIKDKLMPFHRKRCGLGKVTSKYSAPFPHERVLSVKHGWKAEKQLIEEFRTNKKSEDTECMDVITRCIHNGMMSDQVAEFIKKKPPTMKEHISIRGTTYRELRELYLRYGDSKFVMSIEESEEIDVYDLTVNGTHNFATDSAIVHNCQIGKNNHIFEIMCKNSDIKDELNYLFFFPGMLNMDRELFNLAKNLYIFGDYFVELVIDPEDPKSGILKMQPLPPDSIYRIETIKGKLLEFQQSKSGPDYEALAKVEVTQATDLDLMQSNAIRFAPQQIVHFRIGDHRKTFYPYGVSLIEPARGPAHTMKLLEDSMIVYRLSRAPERRVFYIDVGQLPPFKAEMVVERLKDQLRKRKTTSTRGGPGAGSVEERWTAPSQDEDFWIPTRPNSNTRVETLPGAQGLGEIDDALFFRNKLFIALNFPKIYMAQEDLQVARVPLSQTDLKFARNVERLQHSVEDGLMEIARRHLELRGYPSSLFEDLLIKMTPPSQYRALADNEIKEILYQRAMALMGSGLYSRYDILTKILEYSEEEAKEMTARAIAQQVQDLKLQQMAANPDWMGIVSSQPKGPEMGTDMNGPNPELTGNEPPIPPAEGQAPAQPLTATLSPEQMQGNKAEDTYGKPQTPESKPLPEPTDEEIKQFDLDIIDYSQDIDEEEIDAADLDE